MKTEARVLIFDIETSPIVSYNWGIWEQNAIEVVEDWQILCFAYKWLGEHRTYVVAQNDFRSYRAGVNDDKHVAKALWELFEEAHIIIGHNSDQFDIKKSNARFMYHNLPPPASYRSLDTKKIAKRYAAFTSNKLDDLGDVLKIGRKEQTGGFATWKGCMAGDTRAWNKMKRYNKQDVLLDEQIYLRLRPWVNNHPSISLIENKIDACPKCGGTRLNARGVAYTKVTIVKRYQCVDCKGWSQIRVSEKSGIHYVN